MGFGYLIWKNLTRHRLRFGLTLFAILVAFFLFGVLQSFEEGLNRGAEQAAADRLVVNNRINFTQPLPIAYVNRIRTIDGIERVSHQSWFGGYFREPANFIFTFAIEPESFLDIYREDVILSETARAAFLGNRQGMIAGADVVAEYGWRTGDRVPLSSNIWQQRDGSNTWDLVLEGIYRGAREDDPSNAVYLHYDYFNESRSFGTDLIGSVLVRTADPALNDRVAEAIDARFVNSAAATETATEAAFAQSFVEQLGNIGLIVTSVVGAALFTILIIVANTMVLAIRERTGEIGVMKALGFRAGTVFALVLGEALALALIGGGAGLALAWLLTELTSDIPGFPFALSLSAGTLLRAALLMAGLGLITGTIPAWMAYRLKIVTAFARI